MPQKLKRKNNQNLLPTKLLSSLEQSDKQASTKRRKQFATHTLPKSLATKSLYEIQTNLVESRILLQRALTCCNDDVSNTSIGSIDEDDNQEQIDKGLDTLLDQLVDARNSLCQHVLENDKDEASDSEQSNETQDESDDNDGNNSTDQFQSHYDKLRNQWKKTLNRHYDNMNITKRYNKRDSNSNSKFFQVVDQSFWSQIENTVQHNMLLEEHSQVQKKEEGDKINNAKEKNIPPIVFDDSKIYQNMLQEYINLSTERNTNNAASMAEHRLKLASSARKNKKEDVDRRASKGRKIRYVIHEKLLNFTFPLQREVNSQKNHVIMDEDVLFKSMMGGVMVKTKKSLSKRKK
jgi:protein AATF/BFR2